MDCAQCGKAVIAEATAGLCPACLLRTAVEHGRSRLVTSLLPKLRYFGDYELVDEIAFGGMGVVYRARQVSLDRIVAIKMMRPGVLASEDEIRRFQAEACTAAGMQHPNIVSIHEVGQFEGLHYFSMDFVDGPNLAELIRHRPLPPREAARYVQVLAVAVHYAHSKGILHRDLKPSNILVDAGGNPRITDFGLARPFDSAGMTIAGTVVGTPEYMPPEQAAADGTPLTPAADCYSLGAILYELLTGRPPFQGGSPVTTLRAVLEDKPAPPRSIMPAISRDLEAICLRCLEKDLARRYSSAAELSADLARFLSGEPVLVRPRRRLASVALAAGAVAAAVLLFASLKTRPVAPPPGIAVPVSPVTLSQPLPTTRPKLSPPPKVVARAAAPAPPHDTGPGHLYTFRYNGPQANVAVEIEFRDPRSGGACRIVVEPDADRISLQANPLLGPGLLRTGSPSGYGALENSACSIDLPRTAFLHNDGALEIRLPVSFGASFGSDIRPTVWRLDPATGLRAKDATPDEWTIM